MFDVRIILKVSIEFETIDFEPSDFWSQFLKFHILLLHFLILPVSWPLRLIDSSLFYAIPAMHCISAI